MAVNTNGDKSIPTETEAYSEELAAQEEIYLEVTVEAVHAILTSDDRVPSRRKAEYWRRKIEELELDWE